MLYNELKDKSVFKLEKAIKSYNSIIRRVKKNTQGLFNARYYSSKTIIKEIEEYINLLANSPKEFDNSFITLKFNYSKFNSVLEQFSDESLDATVQSGFGAGGGIVAGVGTAALMPTAAMAIATTFGTASTGTAIASLSGAAATNAAMAWIGGGALAAGGGGMAGGSAFLALAGPIGLGVATVGIISGGLIKSNSNKKIAEKANKKRGKIKLKVKKLKISNLEIEKLIKKTNEHNSGVMNILEELSKTSSNDYSTFSIDKKKKLGALINNVNALSGLINQTVI